MGTHKSSNHDARKKKYTAQFARTEANKKRHLAKMKAENPNYPERKKKCPFLELCAHDHVMCSDAPWKETNCAMEYVLKEMELYGKPIIYLDDLRNNKGCFSAE